jgi:hypothetical protein
MYPQPKRKHCSWLLGSDVAKRAGSLLVPDETMIKWTGPGTPLADTSQKPCPLGVCLKTVRDWVI